mmetsp:Transcript_24277/g.61875  ORF Transcript_24277/g.61875 Transcript_24277/m.61875 type:complete len:248 (+) Transcript_24277:81-824(+)
MGLADHCKFMKSYRSNADQHSSGSPSRPHDPSQTRSSAPSETETPKMLLLSDITTSTEELALVLLRIPELLRKLRPNLGHGRRARRHLSAHQGAVAAQPLGRGRALRCLRPRRARPTPGDGAKARTQRDAKRKPRATLRRCRTRCAWRLGVGLLDARGVLGARSQRARHPIGRLGIVPSELGDDDARASFAQLGSSLRGRRAAAGTADLGDLPALQVSGPRIGLGSLLIGKTRRGNKTLLRCLRHAL